MDERMKYDVESTDKTKQYEAFISIMEVTKKEVDWAYEVWDILIAHLIIQMLIKGQEQLNSYPI